MRLRVWITVWLLLVGGLLFSPWFVRDVSATTFYVGGGGPGNYTTIQEAIDSAGPGDSVYVYSGTYLENAVVGTSISLMGEDRNTTVIDGGNILDALRIDSDWVNVTDLTLTNGGNFSGDAGIELNGVTNCRVSGNILTGNYEGVYISTSRMNYVERNTFLDNKHGIDIDHSGGNFLFGNSFVGSNWKGLNIYYSNDSVIERNHFSDGEQYGAYMLFSHNNTVSNNSFDSNEWDGIRLRDSDENRLLNNTFLENKLGASIFFSDNNTVLNNDFTTNTWYGVHLSDAHGNSIGNNTFSGNADGIRVENSDNNTISGNIVISSVTYGVYLHYAAGNVVYHNNIVDNRFQAWDDTNLSTWDDGYPSGGNYWSDYTGLDLFSGPNQATPGSDAIGDTPYNISGINKDSYPLMSPTVLIPPRPPSSPQAYLSGNGHENVTLTWDLSPDDEGGLKSVTSYGLFRNSSFDPEGLDYQLIAILPNGTTRFVDSSMGEGNPFDHFYKICAKDLSNSSSCSPHHLAKFTRPLNPGPSLISFPLIPLNESVETVLQTVQYDMTWHYDSSCQEWKWYMTSKGYRRGLHKANHTSGLWINVTQHSNLTVAGIVPVQTRLHLHEGWNLVPFPSFNSSYSVHDLKMDTEAVRVEAHNTTPPYLLRVLGDAEILQIGRAYWVKVMLSVDLIVRVV